MLHHQRCTTNAPLRLRLWNNRETNQGFFPACNHNIFPGQRPLDQARQVGFGFVVRNLRRHAQMVT